MSSHSSVHAVPKWKADLIECMSRVFEGRRDSDSTGTNSLSHVRPLLVLIADYSFTCTFTSPSVTVYSLCLSIVICGVGGAD